MPVPFRPLLARPLVAAACLAAVLALGACGPRNTNTTYTPADIGRSAQVSYGVIVSMRPVTIQGQGAGVGTLGGAAAGGVAGSFIGGDPRANILGAIGGAIIGGLAGTMAERSATTGEAMEFIIREDDGQTISVVQTNEERFQAGERVVLTRGARTRIGRVAG
jgi:outer membrane lipoprotein SlyB